MSIREEFEKTFGKLEDFLKPDGTLSFEKCLSSKVVKGCKTMDEFREKVGYEQAKEISRVACAMGSELKGDQKKQDVPTLACKFKKVFNRHMAEYWNPITGFDFVKFDGWVGVVDGVSLKEAIKDKFGMEAVEVVEELIRA